MGKILKVEEDGSLKEESSVEPASDKPAKEKKEKKAAEKKKPAGKKNGKVVPIAGAAEEKKAAAVTIKKVKLVKGASLTIAFDRIEADGSSTTGSENHNAPVHADLKNCFLDLRIHLALLCDYLSTRQIKDIASYDPELVESFSVSGVSIGGNEDDEGIVITGYKTTKRKSVVILNSPFTRIEEVEETRYRYMDDLYGKVGNLMNEVDLYLAGKRAPDPQQSLFPDETFPDNIE